MKIDYSKCNFKKIFLNDKEINVSTIEYDMGGVKLSGNISSFFNNCDSASLEFEKIECLTNKSEMVTLFDVIIKLRDFSTPKPYIYLSFNAILYGIQHKLPGELKFKFGELNPFLKNVLNFNKISIDENVELVIESDSLSIKSYKNITFQELYLKFIQIYEYLNLLYGYFFPIDDIIYIANNTQMNYKFNIVDKYITKNQFIRSDTLLVIQLDNNLFLSSYKKFISLRKKMEIVFDVCYHSMMEKNSYPEFSIVNLLQSFDGLFDGVNIFKKAHCLFDDNIKKKIINRYIKVDFSDIYNGKLLNKERISGILGQINKPSFSEKIKYISNIDENLFFREKNIMLQNDKSYFENLISKFTNTRNKFSHAKIKGNDYLSGKDSATYIYKLILAFRLCVMKEIGLEYDKTKLNLYISRVDDWISKKIKLQ